MKVRVSSGKVVEDLKVAAEPSPAQLPGLCDNSKKEGGKTRHKSRSTSTDAKTLASHLFFLDEQEGRTGALCVCFVLLFYIFYRRLSRIIIAAAKSLLSKTQRHAVGK